MNYQSFVSTVDGDTTVYFLAHAPASTVAPACTVGMLRLDPDGFIRALFVAEEYRDHGIGSTLVKQACHWCKECGLESIGLSVGDDNPRARQLYRRLGFVKYMPGHEGYTQFVKVL